MIPLKNATSALPVHQKQHVLSESEQKRLKLQKATQAFEAIFIAQLLKSMRSTSFATEKEDGFGKDIMVSMADEAVSRQLSKKNALGIGKMLYNHLAKRLEDFPGTTATNDAASTLRSAVTETPRADRPRRLRLATQAGDKAATPQQPAEKPSPVVPIASETRSTSERSVAPSEEDSPALKKYIDHIRSAAEETSLPEELLKSMILRESGGNEKAVSRKGAAGLMQLMPDTAKAMGVADRFDPKENILGGAKYLRSLVDRFGDLKTALAAYNAGPTAVARNGGEAPYSETREYVEAILSDLSVSK